MKSKLRNAIVETIKKYCKLPEERTFLTIQNRLLFVYPQFEIGKDGRFKQNYTEKDIFDVLLSLKEEYEIILTSPEIKKYIDLKGLSIREQEAFGLACKDINLLYEKIKMSKQKELEYLGPSERGYLFYLYLNGNEYVVKPFQSVEEKRIALHASKVGLGPQVYGSGKRWLWEELLKGNSVSNLPHSDLIGHLVGNFFGRLHREGIVLNHHRFPEELIWNPVNAELRMVDFGTAEYSTDFSKDYKHIQQFFKTLKDGKTAKKLFFEEYNLRLHSTL